MAQVGMSVVIIAYNDSASLRLVFERLQLQTVAQMLECVLVTADSETADVLRRNLHGLAGIQTVVMSTIGSAGCAKAAGIAAATAPLVAFLEDHSLPEDNWAESLMKAHESDLAAVGPLVQNANPETGASWGCFLVYYGHYMFVRPTNALNHLPANHSCYRRHLLLEYGSRLPDLLEAEFVLHEDLLARGLRIFQEPSARVHHLNHSRLGPSMEEYLFSSRVFAAARATKWKISKRMLYVFGSPLLPLVRSFRIMRDILKTGLSIRIVAKGLPAALLILCSGAAGEMMGYAFGPGRAKMSLKSFETRRPQIISERDLSQARKLF